tara:strand:+ start:725 stop:844 length:120 start_codon:yes stop_codon:yes gene_type:complete
MPWEAAESEVTQWDDDEDESESITQAPDPEELGFDVPVL